MKKFLFLALILSGIMSTNVNAQGGPQAQGNQDPAAILQKMKDTQKQPMIEKTGLTAAQADRIIEINLELRQSMMTNIRDLSEADRGKKMAEFKAAKEKKYSEIPLTADQIKAVYSFYEEMGKNRQVKPGN